MDRRCGLNLRRSRRRLMPRPGGAWELSGEGALEVKTQVRRGEDLATDSPRAESGTVDQPVAGGHIDQRFPPPGLGRVPIWRRPCRAQHRRIASVITFSSEGARCQLVRCDGHRAQHRSPSRPCSSLSATANATSAISNPNVRGCNGLPHCLTESVRHHRPSEMVF